MAESYHINTLSGNVNRCHTGGERCPFGTKAEHFTDYFKATQALREKQFNTIGASVESYFDEDLYYADKARLVEVLAKASRHFYRWSNQHMGTFDPTSGEGTAASFYEGTGYFILADEKGARARVVARGSVPLAEGKLEEELGNTVEQHKVGKSGEAIRMLRIVGVCDQWGNKWGYIPMKKVAFFKQI